MGKYERRTRPGWMLYHENLPMLEALPPEDVKALIVALTRYSIALANDEPPPDFSSVASPMTQAICLLIAPKIERDDSLYKTKCERSALNRSRQKVTAVDHGQPELTKAGSGRATITGTLTVTETGTPTVTETGTETGAESRSGIDSVIRNSSGQQIVTLPATAAAYFKRRNAERVADTTTFLNWTFSANSATFNTLNSWRVSTDCRRTLRCTVPCWTT